MPYEFIEHTADLGFRVYGETLEELFKSAMKAVMDSMIERKGIGEKKEMKYEVSAETPEDLLVDFLSEIIYGVEVEEKVFTDCDLKIENGTLSATLTYEKFDPRIHEFKLEIKSITYHNLKIRKEGKYFVTEVICDI